MKKTLIPLGPFHPLLEEAEYYSLYVDGETVVDVDLRIGYMHRGHEKLSEQKTFDQSIFLVERICGICSTSHPFACVNAIEDAGGIEVPERAKYIRTIIGELERIHSHLLWLGLAGHFIGYDTVFMWAWRYREPLLDICELITGNRNHYAMFNVGGVRRDLKEEDYPAINKMLDEVETATKMFLGAVLDDPVLHARTKGIGILTEEDARNYGATGPTSRGSNIPDDIRKDDPYAAYGMVDWKVITWDSCDVFAKAAVRILECLECVKIIKGCLEQMKPGPIDAGVNTVRAAEGVGHHEAPRGEVFHYVRTNGTNSVARHKVRAPSFVNIPTYKTTIVGEKIADAALISAAVDPCYCCTERRTKILDADTKKLIMTGDDLVRLSREKTWKIKEEFGITSPLEKLRI